MSSLSAQKKTSLNSIEDLFKLSNERVDICVIQYIIKGHDNNLKMACKDLLKITNSSNFGLEDLFLSSLNDDENQPAVTNSDTTHFIDGDRLSNNETPINKITYLISKNCKVMVLMRGCPGSGKSFQAINILNLCYRNANVDEFIFSADKYFIDKRTGEYNFNISKLSFAHTWAYNKAQKAVGCDVTPVIIDNTNVQSWEMKKYVELAILNGYWIEFIEPVSEWAWDAKKLFNKTTHSVPYNKICLMLQQYDYNITHENLFTKFNLKYSINNMPPKLSSSPRKYQLAENLLDKIEVVNTPLTESNDLFVNNQFKNCISQNHSNTKNNKRTSSDNSDDRGIKSLIQEKESHVVSKLINSFYNILNVDEEDQFSSSDEGASKYVSRSVNTCENELLFMNFLNEIPKEECTSYFIYGKSRDINEGNRKKNVFNLSNGKSDKGTLTDHTKNNIHTVLPDIYISLIVELYKHCKGNINCVLKLLTNYGYSLSKQQLRYLLQIIDDVQNGPKHKKHFTKSISKKNKFQTIDGNLDNKFVLDDSLGSQVKKNENILDRDNIISNNIKENLISVKDDEQKLVQLVMETSVLTQLCDYFHDFSPDLNKNTLMMAQIPEKLAKDLYSCLITNVSSYISEQKTIMRDEILARKLQEEENIQKEYPFKNSNHFNGKMSFSAALSKPKLSEICKNANPEHMDVYRNTDLKFQDTGNNLNNEHHSIVTQNSPINQDSPSIQKRDISEVKCNEPSNQNYEQQLVQHSHRRNICIQKASESIRKKNPASAKHFLSQAKQFKEYENITKYKILEKKFKEKMNLKEIDLHRLSVHEAIHILDLFLDNHILMLRKLNGKNRLAEKITIITGRGKHSPNHIARIKPAVLKRISERDIVIEEFKDEGLVIVVITSNSLLTLEII